jgi:hypothetical protein
VLKRLVSSGATLIAQVDPILTGQVVRDYDECRIAYTEMLEKLSHRTQAAIQRRARILGVDLRKTRIVWRFVDSFEDTVRWRAAPCAALGPGSGRVCGTPARSAPGRSQSCPGPSRRT